MEKEDTLTSVKIHNKMFDDFRIFCVKSKFTLHSLTNRSMYLYLTDKNFREQLHNQIDITYTGSLS